MLENIGNTVTRLAIDLLELYIDSKNYSCNLYTFRIVIVNIDVVAALNTSDKPLTLSQCSIGTKTRPPVAPPRSRRAVSARPSAQPKATENAGRGSGAAAVSSRDVGMSFSLSVCRFTRTGVCLSVCLFVCSHKHGYVFQFVCLSVHTNLIT